MSNADRIEAFQKETQFYAWNPKVTVAPISTRNEVGSISESQKDMKIEKNIM